MTNEQLVALTKLAEEAATLAVEAQTGAQRIVLTELLNILKEQGTLNDAAITAMIDKIGTMAAMRAETAPALSKALADTALALGHALETKPAAAN